MAKGDHLYIQYPGFQHHAIDIGDGTVIEYGGKDTGQATVRRVWRHEFVTRGTYQVKPYSPGAALDPDETVRLAFSRLNERKYDVLDNNCEHFATWCKTHRAMSPQVSSILAAVTLAVGLGLAMIADARASA